MRQGARHIDANCRRGRRNISRRDFIGTLVILLIPSIVSSASRSLPSLFEDVDVGEVFTYGDNGEYVRTDFSDFYADCPILSKSGMARRLSDGKVSWMGPKVEVNA